MSRSLFGDETFEWGHLVTGCDRISEDGLDA
jgi:hypothetical protein